MAIYKIFPNKDTTLYSTSPDKNTGLDPILEIHNKDSNVARSLLSFDTSEITEVIDNLINDSQWQSNIKLFNANTTGIINNSTLYIYPLAQEWNNGTGKLNDTSEITNGASWTWNTYEGGNIWNTSSFGAYITASFPSTAKGGGTWYTGSSTGLKYEVTQSFPIRSPKDLNSNITNIVSSWYSGSINNYGVILKWGKDIEFNPNSSVSPLMSLFSVDTHTIYPPCLEFRWNDYVFNTGSNSNGFVPSSQIVATLPNNKGFFNNQSVQKFRLNVRPQYPVRVFQTSSLYVTNYYLPTSSYYAIKDLDTNEFVIDFDETYTKISADSEGNYFKIFMNGLQPERYYTILIKTNIDGETLIIDNDNYFKVING
jgi:hypothetical protein